MIVILRGFYINQENDPTKNPKRFRKICFTITLLVQHLLFYSGCLPQDCQRETWIQYGAGSYCMKIRHYLDFKFQTFNYTLIKAIKVGSFTIFPRISRPSFTNVS